jgi:hypothetical protein
MKRVGLRVGLLALLGLAFAAITSWQTPQVEAQGTAKVSWIWHNDKSPALEQPVGTRYFRKVFEINRPIEKPVDEGQLDITADDEFTVWVNGTLVGKSV